MTDRDHDPGQKGQRLRKATAGAAHGEPGATIDGPETYDRNLNLRKKYSKEFKLDAVSLVIDQDFAEQKQPEVLVLMPICWVAG